MAERVCAAMGDMGIDVQTEQPVREIEVDADGVVRAVRTDAGSYAPISSSSASAWARRWRWPETPGCGWANRRDRGRPHPAQPLAPGGLRRRRLLADLPPDHRRGAARRARHARQQAGPGRRLGDRRPAGPLRRRPGDGDDEGRRPRGRADRAVHHAGRERRLRLPQRDSSRGRRGPATTRAPRRSRSS